MTDAERKNLVLGEGPRDRLSAEDGEKLSKLIKVQVAAEAEKLKADGVLFDGDVNGEMWARMPPGGLKL